MSPRSPTTSGDHQLWLYQTPQQIKPPLSSRRMWFSDSTRTIPLRQFGYPANHHLCLNSAGTRRTYARYMG